MPLALFYCTPRSIETKKPSQFYDQFTAPQEQYLFSRADSKRRYLDQESNQLIENWLHHQTDQVNILLCQEVQPIFNRG